MGPRTRLVLFSKHGRTYVCEPCSSAHLFQSSISLGSIFLRQCRWFSSGTLIHSVAIDTKFIEILVNSNCLKKRRFEDGKVCLSCLTILCVSDFTSPFDFCPPRNPLHCIEGIGWMAADCWKLDCWAAGSCRLWK